MTRDNNNQPGDSDDDLNEFARDPFRRDREEQAKRQGIAENQDPRGDLEEDLREDFDDDFEDDFDNSFDDDPYDEPERDTAYPPAYREEDDADEDYEEQQPLLREATASRAAHVADVKDDHEDDHDKDDEDDYLEDERDPGEDSQWSSRIDRDDPDSWLDDEQDADGGNYNQRLPMALLIVAVIAVVLLIAGGYGVMQQRAESNEEIRELRGALATAASSEDIEKARAEAEALRVENNDLEDRIYDLEIENRKLTDLVAGLEAQVEAINPSPNSQEAAKPAAAVPAPKPDPVEKPQPQAKPATTAAPGSWFVNFGSYGQLAAAEAWQARLQPGAGEVITAPGERDGRTFYRVRVVNLPDKATAQSVARELEKTYNLPKLWVGQQ